MFTIYAIKNTMTDKIYIGVTVDLDVRFRRHCSVARARRYHNRPLYQDWKDEAMVTFILSQTESQEEATKLETQFIKEYDTTNEEKGYNISRGGNGLGNFGCKFSEDSKSKIRSAATGRVMDYETKRKMSEARKAYWATKKAAV